MKTGVFERGYNVSHRFRPLLLHTYCGCHAVRRRSYLDRFGAHRPNSLHGGGYPSRNKTAHGTIRNAQPDSRGRSVRANLFRGLCSPRHHARGQTVYKILRDAGEIVCGRSRQTIPIGRSQLAGRL